MSEFAEGDEVLGWTEERASHAELVAVQRYGVHGQGTHAIATAARLAEVAGLVADGTLEIPIAATYPLDRAQDAYRELAERHTHGKIVLMP